MSFIVLSDGSEMDLMCPRAENFTALDIAWGLAQKNRFNGRTIRPYSVAEHSLLVCEIAERELGCNLYGLLAALMHDAHEAYTGDMNTNAKAFIGTAWHEWESRWEYLVHRAFAIVSISHGHRRLVKQADLMALATERRDLMPRALSPWPTLHGIEPVEWVNLNSKERRAMDWEDWRDRWLDRYHELEFARNERLYTAPKNHQLEP